MSTIPPVSPGDWIKIGQKDAVISRVYTNGYFGDVEVVYIDGAKAINEDILWKEDHWEFAKPGPNGGYADRNPDLREFVVILRNGRRFS